MQFIDQARLQILPDCRRPASDANVLAMSSLASAFKRNVNPLSNEMKGRATFHDQWRTRMMREHENLRMINRVLTPPASPALITP